MEFLWLMLHFWGIVMCRAPVPNAICSEPAMPQLGLRNPKLSAWYIISRLAFYGCQRYIACPSSSDTTLVKLVKSILPIPGQHRFCCWMVRTIAGAISWKSHADVEWTEILSIASLTSDFEGLILMCDAPSANREFCEWKDSQLVQSSFLRVSRVVVLTYDYKVVSKSKNSYNLSILHIFVFMLIIATT